MIQRIQSIYLVLALVGLALLFMFPTATFDLVNPQTNTIEATASLDLVEQATTYDQTGIIPTFVGQGSVLLMILVIVIAVGTLVSIFLFKNRILQMRLVALTLVLTLAYIAIVFVSTIDGCVADLQASWPIWTVNMHYGVGTFAPLAVAVLLFLAQQAIKKDELKVRAADRLR
jgi:hypothetical protein